MPTRPPPEPFITEGPGPRIDLEPAGTRVVLHEGDDGLLLRSARSGLRIRTADGRALALLRDTVDERAVRAWELVRTSGEPLCTVRLRDGSVESRVAEVACGGERNASFEFFLRSPTDEEEGRCIEWGVGERPGSGEEASASRELVLVRGEERVRLAEACPGDGRGVRLVADGPGSHVVQRDGAPSATSRVDATARPGVWSLAFAWSDVDPIVASTVAWTWGRVLDRHDSR